MSSLGAGFEDEAAAFAARMTSIFYTLDGVERELPLPAGADRWDLVAKAVSLQRGREARAPEPPSYDCGTRRWCLPVEVRRRWRGVEVVPVAVRW